MKRVSSLAKRQKWSLTLMALPGLLVYVLGMLIPIAIGFAFSLTDWSGISDNWRFVGFSNYGQLLNDERFYSAMSFTVLFAIANTILQNIIALGLAMLLNQKIQGTTMARTVVFAPCLISAIIVGIVWSQLFGSIFPDIMKTLGVTDISVSLLSSPETVLGGLLIINNWQWAGYWMLIYLAALQAVPPEVYEAAYIDGAGPIRRFVRITIPLIRDFPLEPFQGG